MDETPTGIRRLLDIMARLRAPDSGCPWDVEQTFATIAPYTIEEAYEVADAIERGDMAALEEELGDLLLQVVFHARMAEERGAFDFSGVTRAISDKMVRRHPHVFGSGRVEDAEAQTIAWEDHKARERAANGTARSPAGTLDGLPLALPALVRAVKLQRRAARVGFDWDETEPVLEKVHEELCELRAALADDDGTEKIAEEFGDLMFSMANLARWLRIDPESALRAANAKFERRFRRIEAQLAAAGRGPEDATPLELEALWERAKDDERKAPRRGASGQESEHST